MATFVRSSKLPALTTLEQPGAFQQGHLSLGTTICIAACTPYNGSGIQSSIVRSILRLEFRKEIVMSAKIPENYLDLFHKKAFGSFTTLMPDGSPADHTRVGGLR